MMADQRARVHAQLSAKDAAAVAAIRQQLPERYRACTYLTDFNVLRWVHSQASEAEAAAELLRHLQRRHALHLDDNLRAPSDELHQDYIPLVVVGATGVSNAVLVCESAGQYDFAGLEKALRPTAFLLQRINSMEAALAQVMALEASTGKQASVTFVLDLAGLSLSTQLINFVTGPLRLLTKAVLTNYPELIKTTVVVNAPTSFGLLWAAVRRVLPKRELDRVVVTQAGNALHTLRAYVSNARLPRTFGGDLPDEKAGLKKPINPIPQRWFCVMPPDLPKTLWRCTVTHKKTKYMGFNIPQTHVRMSYFVHASNDYTFGFFFAAASTQSADSFEQLFPAVELPMVAAGDCGVFDCERVGFYYLRFGTTRAGLLARAVKISLHATFKTAAGPIDCPRLKKLKVLT